MSSCERFEDSLWSAAAGEEVPPDLAAHLEHCSTCRESLQALTRAVRGLAALRGVDAPDPRAAVHARLAQTSRRGRRALVLAVAAVVCSACAVALLRITVPPRPQQPARVVATPRGDQATPSRQLTTKQPARRMQIPRHATARAPPQLASKPGAAPVPPLRMVPARSEPQPQRSGLTRSQSKQKHVGSPVLRPGLPTPASPACQVPPGESSPSQTTEVASAPSPDSLSRFSDPARCYPRFVIISTTRPDRALPPLVSPDPTYQALAVPTVWSAQTAPSVDLMSPDS